MNKVIISGNITRDPERKETSKGNAVTSFTVAVSKKYKNDDGTYGADFINCVAWRGTADFVSKYFFKGSRINVIGSLNTRSYEDKDGNKRFVTEVLAEEVEFGAPKEKTEDDFSNLKPLDDNDLPF